MEGWGNNLKLHGRDGGSLGRGGGSLGMGGGSLGMGGGSLGRGGGWLGRGDGRITQIATKSDIRAHAIYDTFALPSDTRPWENHVNSEQQQQQARSVPSITD